MTASLDLPLYLRTGKTNMAAEAFRAVRLENRAQQTRLEKTPESGETTASIGQPSLGFGDLLDALNPLQHLPIVASVYRSVTEDTIGPLARVAGGLLYGGPIGLAISLGDAILEQASGDDLGSHLMATLFSSDEPPLQTAAIAAPADAPADTLEAAPSASKPLAGLVPPAPKPLAAIESPTLSPEMLNALFASFKDPNAAQAANPQLTRAARPGPVNSGAAPSDPDSHRQKAPPQLIAGREPPRDLLGALRQSLDKYEALHGQPLALDTSVQLP